MTNKKIKINPCEKNAKIVCNNKCLMNSKTTIQE